MEGFTYINQDSIPDIFCCAVCCDPLVDPVEHPGNSTCSQLYCSKCVTNFNQCPHCRSEVSIWHKVAVTSSSQRMLFQPLSDLKVQCKTCQLQLSRGDAQAHTQKCAKACIHGCGQIVAPVDEETHAALCNNADVVCAANKVRCQWTGKRGHLQEHLSNCSYYKFIDFLTSQQAQLQQADLQAAQMLQQVQHLQQQIQHSDQRAVQSEQQLAQLQQQVHHLQQTQRPILCSTYTGTVVNPQESTTTASLLLPAGKWCVEICAGISQSIISSQTAATALSMCNYSYRLTLNGHEIVKNWGAAQKRHMESITAKAIVESDSAYPLAVVFEKSASPPPFSDVMLTVYPIQ